MLKILKMLKRVIVMSGLDVTGALELRCECRPSFAPVSY